jgi:hypothetical protein
MDGLHAMLLRELYNPVDILFKRKADGDFSQRTANNE